MLTLGHLCELARCFDYDSEVSKIVYIPSQSITVEFYDDAGCRDVVTLTCEGPKYRMSSWKFPKGVGVAQDQLRRGVEFVSNVDTSHLDG